jgi:hypothetical protein
MDPVKFLFFVGIVMLLLFLICLILRTLVVAVNGRRVIRHGILPRQGPEPDSPLRASGRCCLGENEVACLMIVFGILAVHGLVTDGVWGLVKTAIGIVVILGLGPLMASWFWASADSDDVLARMCHRLLNWSVACLTIPILSLL